MFLIWIRKYVPRPFKRWIRNLQGWSYPIFYWTDPPLPKVPIVHSIPMYCINLDRAIERRAFIEKKWIEELGFDINFWKAQDQRDLTEEDYRSLTKSDEAIKRVGRVLTRGEVACALSHRQLYEYILKLGLEEVIVLEDDVGPNFLNREYFFNYIQQGKIEFPKADLFLLYDGANTFKKNENKLFFSTLKVAPFGSQLLYYTRAGLKKMVLGLEEINGPIDLWGFYLFQDGTIALSNKPLGLHLNETSYIGNAGHLRKFIP